MPLDQLGPYKIQRMLGRGGMGAVYVGVNSETGEKAALKVLSPVLADDPGFRERFKAEIETLKKLRQPNIVQLYGFGEHDGALFYAMELVEGRNLQDELQAGRKFEWREVCRIGIEICLALKHAHDVGVIHRDLKPANLLITPTGQIKLSDFGIARFYGMTQLTADGGVLGTADYMAPEQADGRPVTTRCDMYSLGSVLFALLARRPPFAAATLPEVLHALKYDPAPSVKRFAPHTPDELDAIIAELLAKDPQDRVATPLVLSNRLKAMLHALSADRVEKNAAADGDDFVLRPVEDEPAGTRIGMRTTVGPLLEAEAEDEIEKPRPTRAMTRPAVAAAPNEAANAASAEAPATMPARHFTMVDNQAEAALVRATTTPDEGVPLWITAVAAGVLVAIVAGLGWWFAQPASAETLYAKIQQAVAEDDPVALANAESYINDFLAHYSGDPRYEEVAGFQQELEVQRLQRRLEVRARRLRGGDALLPVEQAYLDAMSLERTAPDVAVEKLQALIEVYGSDPDASRNTERCVDLARRQWTSLRLRQAKSREEHAKVLAARLDDARAASKQDPETATMICAGIVTLYGDKPWAAEPVAQAKALLEWLKMPEGELPK